MFFSLMIENNIPFKTKDFNVLRSLIDSKERLLVSLNDQRFTITHDNIKKGGKMYNSLKNMYTSYYINNWGSDKVKQEVIKGIESGSLTRVPRPKKVRRNKNGGQFKYLNTTDIDLTRYQIIKDESQLEIIKEHCIIQSLLNSLLNPSGKNNIIEIINDSFKNNKKNKNPQNGGSKLASYIKHLGNDSFLAGSMFYLLEDIFSSKVKELNTKDKSLKSILKNKIIKKNNKLFYVLSPISFNIFGSEKTVQKIFQKIKENKGK